MLKAKDTPKRFWDDALSTTVHIINNCLIKKMLHKTPYEA